jgi:hypothetical protein
MARKNRRYLWAMTIDMVGGAYYFDMPTDGFAAAAAKAGQLVHKICDDQCSGEIAKITSVRLEDELW